MYGPTGAGKTYTMLGTEKKRDSLRREGISDANRSFIQGEKEPFLPKRSTGNSGILLYTLNYILNSFKGNQEIGTEKINKPVTNIIKCTYVEIYNDNIFDLLQETNAIKNSLSISELDSKEFVIRNAIECTVSSLDDLFNVIRKGESNIYALIRNK